MRALLLGLIRIYRFSLGPLLGPSCRFVPSCSTYMEQALLRLSLWRGLVLGCRRLLRCHPWGGSGWDPVPSPPESPTSCREREVHGAE
ncbi:MAG: membrane protein insertion efficiency factor YidD [Polyangiales bacterium]